MSESQGTQRTDPTVSDHGVIPLARGLQSNLLLLCLLAVYLIWGSTYLAIRLAVRDIPPLMMAGLRFLVAGSALYAFLRSRGALALGRRQWLAASTAGTLILGFGNGGLSLAEKTVSSGLAAAVVASVPLWAAIFAGFWGQWPSRREWTGLALGFTGVVILSRGAELRENPVVVLVLLAASASFAFGSVWTRYLHLPAGLMGSAAEMLSGGAALMVLSALRREHASRLPSLVSAASFLYLVTLGSIVAYSAYVFVLRNARPTLATSYAFVNPVVAIILGNALIGEHITWSEIIGMVMTLSGTALVLFRPEANACRLSRR